MRIFDPNQGQIEPQPRRKNFKSIYLLNQTSYNIALTCIQFLSFTRVDSYQTRCIWTTLNTHTKNQAKNL